MAFSTAGQSNIMGMSSQTGSTLIIAKDGPDIRKTEYQAFKHLNPRHLEPDATE